MNRPPFEALLSPADAEYLGEVIRTSQHGWVQSLPASAQAFLALSLWNLAHKPIVWTFDNPKSLDTFFQDLRVLAGGSEERLAYFPAMESLPGHGKHRIPDLAGDRMNTLQRCLEGDPPAIVATCIQALFQTVPPPGAFRALRIELRLGSEVDLEALLAHLEKAGYVFDAEVLQKGQAARRGGVLDLWPPTEDWPLRLEFFGPILDSIRAFDPAAQRSAERRQHVVIPPADETRAASGEEGKSELAAYLPVHTIWAWSEPDSLFHHAETYRALLKKQSGADFHELRMQTRRQFHAGSVSVGIDSESETPARELDLRPCEPLPSWAGNRVRADRIEEARQAFVAELEKQAGNGGAVHLFFSTEGARDRFLETRQGRPKFGPGFHIHLGTLSEGFTCPGQRLTVVAESDLYGIRKKLPGRYELHGRKGGPDAQAGARLAEWTDIQPGELVVHLDHGIGKYLGLYEISFHGQKQETMAIEYADKAKLYVPVAQAHLLSRYVGAGKRRPGLHALGGKRWAREKGAVEKAVQDLAATLLDTQARRETLEGFAFQRDAPWQHEFEAAFPFQETEDQRRAIQDIKQDMESRRPMDRLICGDVGYGKTEVAMRAAFKAVMSGKQVALLVPTTILAQQHFDTFTERMSAYPVTIEMLSRFRTTAEQNAVIRRAREGRVDLVVGTHRLLQPDVRFKDLGLVIVDEEQRFGVMHKEHFKSLRQMVDVITLTATPIPRTLYMSLTGAKDMSTIQTPPQDRLPIETIVAQNTDEVVREAILREINRGGQVFYLHNRVASIHHVRDRLGRVAPEARVAVGHGQMPEDELAEVMHRFMRGEFDVLLCTTIIESGVDIPNVNTILIDRADRFGMADLYQLRGRVGRYKHQAYAYLLLPMHGHLFDTARQRITAIQRHSSLGAGFKLALRDLEIRGAGNLLGAEQSGHIAAVGFELYCQLLKRTVSRLKGDPMSPIIETELKLDFIDLAPSHSADENAAVIPPDYIEDENLRVGYYRKLAAACREEDVDQLAAEARDRFGPMPDSLARLLKVARLRIAAAGKGLRSIEVMETKVVMTRGGELLSHGGKFPRLAASTALDRLVELIGIVRHTPG